MSRVFLSDVFQDFLDGCGLGDEGKELHLGPTAPTGQWVDFIDSVDELVGFRNVDEGSGQKLERVEQLLVQNVMSGLGLINNEIGLWMKSKSGLVHGSPHEITRQLVHFLGVAGIDGGVVVNAKAKVIPTMPPDCKR